MRLTISTRLFLALTALSLIALTLNAAITRWNLQRGFLDYVVAQELATITAIADELATLHRENGDWQAIENDPRRFRDLLRRSSGPKPHDEPRGRPDDRQGRPPPDDRPGRRPPDDPLGFGRRISLVDLDGNQIAGDPQAVDDALSVPVLVNGAPLAYVRIAPQRELTNRQDQDFFREQERSMVIAAALALLLAALMSALLARQFTRPIRSLAGGARAISGGAYDTRIPELRDDELGDLASEFNQLAATLERNRESRRRWVSDIAHELRTPLAVLRGELEAIDDGVRSFDDGTRRSLAAEVGRLTTLVSELHDLSRYDEGEERYDVALLDVRATLGVLVGDARHRFSDAGIDLDLSASTDVVLVAADSARLERVFLNVLENSLRYTDTPGKLNVSLEAGSDEVTIEFADTGPGVPQDALPRLFDRLFRVDASRSRQTGGSGLGLAICKAIVEAHGGSIGASASSLGGLAITVVLPLADTGHSRT